MIIIPPFKRIPTFYARKKMIFENIIYFVTHFSACSYHIIIWFGQCLLEILYYHDENEISMFITWCYEQACVALNEYFSNYRVRDRMFNITYLLKNTPDCMQHLQNVFSTYNMTYFACKMRYYPWSLIPLRLLSFCNAGEHVFSLPYGVFRKIVNSLPREGTKCLPCKMWITIHGKIITCRDLI